jgi:hypothetical protein
MLDAELGPLWQETNADGADDERPAVVQQPDVIPGLTDVLDAELGPWWLDDDQANSHPPHPYPIGFTP